MLRLFRRKKCFPAFKPIKRCLHITAAKLPLQTTLQQRPLGGQIVDPTCFGDLTICE